MPPLAEGDRLPREVFSGVPLHRYDGRELSVEPAPHHQGGRLRGGPALLRFHLQLHHVSQRFLPLCHLQYDISAKCLTFHFLHF